MSYRKTFNIISNLETKRLAANKYYDNDTDSFCALGSLVQGEAVTLNYWQNTESVADEHSQIYIDLGFEKLGLTGEEASALQEYNDSFKEGKESFDVQEERYNLVLQWLLDKI